MEIRTSPMCTRVVSRRLMIGRIWWAERPLWAVKAVSRRQGLLLITHRTCTEDGRFDMSKHHDARGVRTGCLQHMVSDGSLVQMLKSLQLLSI